MIRLYVGRHESRGQAMEKIWRFRHEQFVERLGWEALRRNDGLEIDQFDHDRALHLALFFEDTVVGYTRLLPTTEPHLLSDVYPQIMKGQAWPRSPEIFEWTRCIVAEGQILINGVSASHVLMTGVMEFCLVAGITSVIVETHPKLVQLLVSTGWNVTELGPPSLLNGVLIVPIQAKPSMSGLRKHHQLYSIQGSTLLLEPEVRNPLKPEATLHHLHYCEFMAKRKRPVRAVLRG
ncbi:acyl-homoserine-lactone synthase [Rhizobium leguminosarum]|uniref:acyl-homoserine-lactone synthase n=1 Tax=Rhizobium leguminosarum TaxID=384 RepID=UPI001FE18416|nr:acyl-homoserine-lactone synthase [Rhizobium leguminosarum]